MFPKVPDRHKPGKPLVPNGFGVFYVITSAVYLFLLHYFYNNSSPELAKAALALAGCILFGGFLGLLDDWIDLRWRYKAFLPLFAFLPLAVLREGKPEMATYIFGKINFSAIYFDGIPIGEILFYFFIIPVIVTVVTNTINQLGGLNGLETVCPSIIMLGLIITSSNYSILLAVPLVTYLTLALFNIQGKIFVGNTGSFAIGITLASYAVLANIEQTLLIALLPYIFNSYLILLNIFLFKRRAALTLKGGRLHSAHKRSLATLIAYYRPSTEKQLVALISSLIGFFTFLAVLVWWLG